MSFGTIFVNQMTYCSLFLAEMKKTVINQILKQAMTLKMKLTTTVDSNTDCMREFLLFRSFDQIILNILSFEKDLLRLKKNERIMKSIRMLLKSIIKTRLKFFLLIPAKNLIL